MEITQLFFKIYFELQHWTRSTCIFTVKFFRQIEATNIVAKPDVEHPVHFIEHDHLAATFMQATTLERILYLFICELELLMKWIRWIKALLLWEHLRVRHDCLYQVVWVLGAFLALSLIGQVSSSKWLALVIPSPAHLARDLVLTLDLLVESFGFRSFLSQRCLFLAILILWLDSIYFSVSRLTIDATEHWAVRLVSTVIQVITMFVLGSVIVPMVMRGVVIVNDEDLVLRKESLTKVVLKLDWRALIVWASKLPILHVYTRPSYRLTAIIQYHSRQILCVPNSVFEVVLLCTQLASYCLAFFFTSFYCLVWRAFEDELSAHFWLNLWFVCILVVTVGRPAMLQLDLTELLGFRCFELARFVARRW